MSNAVLVYATDMIYRKVRSQNYPHIGLDTERPMNRRIKRCWAIQLGSIFGTIFSASFSNWCIQAEDSRPVDSSKIALSWLYIEALNDIFNFKWYMCFHLTRMTDKPPFRVFETLYWCILKVLFRQSRSSLRKVYFRVSLESGSLKLSYYPDLRLLLVLSGLFVAGARQNTYCCMINSVQLCQVTDFPLQTYFLVQHNIKVRRSIGLLRPQWNWAPIVKSSVWVRY